MNALEELEQRLGIQPINFDNLDTLGIEFSIPSLPQNDKKCSYVYPQIKLATFTKLDELWNVAPRTSQQLYNQLIEQYEKITHSVTNSAQKQQTVIQKILNSMQCGNLSKVKLNDMLNELASYGE